MRTLTLLCLVLCSLLMTACRESAQPTTTPSTHEPVINLSYDPNPPKSGQGMLVIAVNDENGQAVEVQSVSVRGDMTHAGMVPVTGEEALKRNDNSYRVPFNWSMGGDWILTVDVVLPDGRQISREFNVSVES